MDYFCSMYIDNEMDLDEKRRFVKLIRSDKAFYAQTLALLEQEERLRRALREAAARPKKRWLPSVRHVWLRLFKPLAFGAAGFAAAVLMFFSLPDDPGPAMRSNRFILFEPAADQVELVGSFTGWRRVAMQRIGESGYWELKLDVPSGEHRFAYILDGHRPMADPTLPAIEKDDFGGLNSILTVEGRT
jgi:hypothetical protein